MYSLRKRWPRLILWTICRVVILSRWIDHSDTVPRWTAGSEIGRRSIISAPRCVARRSIINYSSSRIRLWRSVARLVPTWRLWPCIWTFPGGPSHEPVIIILTETYIHRRGIICIPTHIVRPVLVWQRERLDISSVICRPGPIISFSQWSSCIIRPPRWCSEVRERALVLMLGCLTGSVERTWILVGWSIEIPIRTWASPSGVIIVMFNSNRSMRLLAPCVWPLSFKRIKLVVRSFQYGLGSSF